MARAKQTGDAASSDAGSLMALARRGGTFVWVGRGRDGFVLNVTGEVKRTAASALTQDQTRGKRKTG